MLRLALRGIGIKRPLCGGTLFRVGGALLDRFGSPISESVGSEGEAGSDSESSSTSGSPPGSPAGSGEFSLSLESLIAVIGETTRTLRSVPFLCSAPVPRRVRQAAQR